MFVFVVLQILWWSNACDCLLQILGFDTSMESLIVGGRSGSFVDLNNSDFGLSSKSFISRDLFPTPRKLE